MYSNCYRGHLPKYRIISMLMICLLVCACISRMAVTVCAQENEKVEYVGNTTVTAYVMEAPQELPEDISEEEGKQTNSTENDARTGDTNQTPQLIFLAVFSVLFLIAGIKYLIHN